MRPDQACTTRAARIENEARDLLSCVGDLFARANAGTGRIYAANRAQVERQADELREAINFPEPKLSARDAPGPLMLPREPTEDMMQAGLYASGPVTDWAEVNAMWKAMFDAASLDGGTTTKLPAGRDAPEPSAGGAGLTANVYVAADEARNAWLRVDPNDQIGALSAAVDAAFAARRSGAVGEVEAWPEEPDLAAEIMQVYGSVGWNRAYFLAEKLRKRFARTGEPAARPEGE